MTYLITYPLTLINDSFGDGNNRINTNIPKVNYKCSIIQGKTNSPEFRSNAEFYQYVGVDIVTETVFDYPYTFITEKTYRSIAEKRPFIIVGAYNTLSFLKSHGFRTFNQIIDETYDTVKDPVERWHLVCNSIKQFITQPIEKIRSDVDSVSDVLHHNYNVLANLESVQLAQIESLLNSL